MTIITNPKEIESKSFELIDKYLKNVKLPTLQKEVAKRVIHATADFSYAKQLIFHPQAIEAGLAAIRNGKNIVVDANMVKAGINKDIVSRFWAKVICLIDDKDIIQKCTQLKITRAILAMRKSAKLMDGGIVAVGNSPTGLFELCDLVEKGQAKPALIVGVPVGFVGAKEAKKRLLTLKTSYVTNLSRKGGSSVAIAIVNALLKIAERKGK